MTYRVQASLLKAPGTSNTPLAFLSDSAFPCLFASHPQMHPTFSPQLCLSSLNSCLKPLTQKLPPPLSLLQTSPFLLNTKPLCPPSWSSSHAYVSNLMHLIFLSRTLEIERNFVENSKEPVFYAIKKLLSPIK